MNLRDLPSDDAAAWIAYPAARWVYCRLTVALAVGVQAAPAGVDPFTFPVIYKPTLNLWGMGRRAYIAHEAVPYEAGMFWSEVLAGRHVSTDAVVENGIVLWAAQAIGLSDGPSRFVAWFLGDRFEPELEAVACFVRDHLPKHVGAVNVETIGARIIEVHLRLTQDWLQAGAYDAYPGPCERMLGIPLWSPAEPSLPDWVKVHADDGDPRHALLTCAVPR